MLKETKDGIILTLRISPNASKNEIIQEDSGLKVKITALPQMIAAFNGLGGLASALIGLAEVWNGTLYPFQVSVGIVIGSIAFAGSAVAYAKLHGFMQSDFGDFPLQNAINAVLLLVLG